MLLNYDRRTRKGWKIGEHKRGYEQMERFAESDRSIPRLEADLTLFHARKLRVGRRFTDALFPFVRSSLQQTPPPPLVRSRMIFITRN